MKRGARLETVRGHHLGSHACKPSADFALYAQAYRAHGHHVTEIGEFAPTLEAAFMAGGVHVVAVPIHYSEKKRVLVDELRDRRPTIPVR